MRKEDFPGSKLLTKIKVEYARCVLMIVKSK
jgi:hypothetical protein